MAEKLTAVEKRLKSLYKLQEILSEIDRIKQIRGELPLEVKDLEDEIAGLQTRLANFNNDIEDMEHGLANEKTKINNAQALIARYKMQLDNVQNNREFDLLNKEIEFQGLEVEGAEKSLRNLSAGIENRRADVERIQENIVDREHILADKRKELEEIVDETREQEERLRQEAKDVEATIDDERTLTAFKRIRKNARNGLGIVCVERDACGGCFNRIPPQKRTEIKMHKKVIVCEYCGRIMVDSDLVKA